MPMVVYNYHKSGLTLEKAILACSDLYKTKMGFLPTVCYLHPETVLELIDTTIGIKVLPDKSRFRFDIGFDNLELREVSP